jgi:hypothetical protein
MQRSLLPIAATAALSFAAYAAFVQLAPFSVPVVQNQIDSNMMRAQNFLAAPPATVLVGSSLTYRLPEKVLGPDTANIGLMGGSALTGLSLVDRSGERPGLVLIESNLFDRPLDQQAVDAQLRFPERILRRYFRVFRTGYDPANLLWRALTGMTHQTEVEAVLTPQAARAFYAEQQQFKARPPEVQLFRHHLQQAQAMVASLQAKGIRVGFFEMPIDPGLSGSPADTMMRRAIAKVFPASRYCWLHLQVPGGAHTVDGVHLTPEDSALVAQRILAQRKLCYSSQRVDGSRSAR